MKLIGLARLGRDAELRTLPSGHSVCNLALAFNYGPKDDQKTTWVDASLWNERAEGLAQYMLKGQQLYVEVRDVHIEEFNKTGGGVGFSLRGNVAEIQFGAPPKDGGGQQGGGGGQRSQGGQQPRGNGGQGGNRERPPARGNGGGDTTRNHGNGGRTQGARAPAADGFSDMDDDIPF